MPGTVWLLMLLGLATALLRLWTGRGLPPAQQARRLAMPVLLPLLAWGLARAALALGAHATMVGRAYLYGLMAGGERGVDRAVEILDGEVRRTMKLLGVTRVADLGPRHVRLP